MTNDDLNDLNLAIEDAKNGKYTVRGNYMSRWGKVWRDGETICMVTDDELFPTDKATPEEEIAIRQFESGNVVADKTDPAKDLGEGKLKEDSVEDFQEISNTESDVGFLCYANSTAVIEREAEMSGGFYVDVAIQFFILGEPVGWLELHNEQILNTKFVVNNEILESSVSKLYSKPLHKGLIKSKQWVEFVEKVCADVAESLSKLPKIVDDDGNDIEGKKTESLDILSKLNCAIEE